ncbi:hypothetical protein Enr8_05900 [Blastopirellula retiformator]|uniref:Uncharacterized protein n=2 Tax=Blastopirellula retiformator TaxID=2527970 RepID=A0A5C5VJV7_9BACT|nr:hypothetical protein Enr8_05900 [Blastopirellula retiformator]
MFGGAAIGGGIGAIVAVSSALIVGGEMAASTAPLGLALTGAIVGTLLGGFTGWGIPRDQEADVMRMLAGRRGSSLLCRVV